MSKLSHEAEIVAVKELAAAIADEIEKDLCDRCGIGDAFGSCDEDIQEEIRQEWRELIRNKLLPCNCESCLHTPGPWHVSRAASTVLVGAEEEVRSIACFTKNMHVEVFGENNVANGILISASPDMLESLQDLVATMDSPSAYAERLRPAIAKARAAIAKATGKEGA